MNGKSKYTITLVLSLLLGLALITGGCSSSDETAPEKAIEDANQQRGDDRSGQDDSKSPDDGSRDIGSQPITESQGREDGGGDENTGRLPPADDRGTDMAPNDPTAGDRRADNAAGRADDNTVARVDTPPEDPDNLMNPRLRTDHQNRSALMRENRDLRSDYPRTNETLARVDTSNEGPNRGFDRRSDASNDPGGGGSEDKMSGRTDSAEDSFAKLAALDRKDNTLDQPDAESRARMAQKDDTAGMKGKAIGEKAETRTASPAQGEIVVVRKRWSKIRRAPRENSRSIALAYGNDSFQVVTREGEWVQVLFGKKNRHKGWLPLSDLSR